jgi:hypothetical protein
MVSFQTGQLFFKEVPMGGLGSGRRYSNQERRPIVEDFVVLDIRTFKDHLNSKAIITQTVFENECEAFKFLIDLSFSDRIKIYYPFKGKNRIQTIKLADKLCNFGGSRTYMLCPECKKKCCVIYLGKNGKWACQRCLGLAYKSQRLNKIKRHLYMVQKIKNKKLRGVPVPVFQKPYRMKTQTHAELVQKLAWHQGKVNESINEWYNEILKKYLT